MRQLNELKRGEKRFEALEIVEKLCKYPASLRCKLQARIFQQHGGCDCQSALKINRDEPGSRTCFSLCL